MRAYVLVIEYTEAKRNDEPTAFQLANGRVGAWHDVLKTCRFALGPKNVHQPWPFSSDGVGRIMSHARGAFSSDGVGRVMSHARGKLFLGCTAELCHGRTDAGRTDAGRTD